MGKKAQHSKLSEEVKAIKRANSRIKYVAKKYGKTSNIYKELTAQWRPGGSMSKYVNYGADGIVQISTKLVKEYHNADRDLIFHQIKKVRGIKEIEQSSKEFGGMEEDEWKKLSKKERRKYVLEMSILERDMRTMVDKLYNMFESGKSTIEKYMPSLMLEEGGTMDKNRLKKAIQEAKDILYNEERLQKEQLGEYEDVPGFNKPTKKTNKKTGYKNPLAKK